MSCNFSEVGIQFNAEKYGVHPFIILAWVKNRAIPASDITWLSVFLDCFVQYNPPSGLIQGLLEELYFTIAPVASADIFFLWEISRYIEEMLTIEQQQVLKLFLIQYNMHLIQKERDNVR